MATTVISVTFAAGDSKIVTRFSVQSTMTDADVLLEAAKLAPLSSAKLMAVQRSILFDQSGIPSDTADLPDKTLSVLLGTENDPSKPTFQVRIPWAIAGADDALIEGALLAPGDAFMGPDGTRVNYVIKSDLKPQRRPKGSA